jgi:hypothetical protein
MAGAFNAKFSRPLSNGAVPAFTAVGVPFSYGFLPVLVLTRADFAV